MRKKARTINPNRIILGMMPRACGECQRVQHVYFTSQEQYDTWDCPICNGRMEPDDETEGELPVPAQEDEVQPSE